MVIPSPSRAGSMALVPLGKVDLSALRWIRDPEAPTGYSLRSGEEAIATLSWDPERRRLARLETADGVYRLERQGFLSPRIALLREGEREVRGGLTSFFEGVHSRHAIALPTGISWILARAGVSVPAWSISESGGTEVAHLEPVREGERLDGAIIEVEKAPPEPEVLVYALALAWYFIALAWFEDEVVAGWVDHGEGRF